MSEKIPEGVKDVSLAGVGALLYLAASPDIADGFSDEEFKLLKENGPAVFQLYELMGRSGLIPKNLQLPAGFGKHFGDEVIPDLETIRKNPHMQEEFRASMRGIFAKPGKLKNLYTSKGTTYSDELSKVAGSNRKGRFYEKSTTPETHSLLDGVTLERGDMVRALDSFTRALLPDAKTSDSLVAVNSARWLSEVVKVDESIAARIRDIASHLSGDDTSNIGTQVTSIADQTASTNA